jgi:hypothetical protein
MASNVTFFTPTDTLAINTLLSLTLSAQWLIQSNTPNRTKERSSGLAANGDEGAWNPYNDVERRTLVYECHALTGNLTVPAVGTVIATGWHIDSAKVGYNAVGMPQLTVQIHKHMGALSHTAASCNTFASKVLLPAQFGIPSVITDDTYDAGPPEVDAVTEFELEVATIGMRALEWGMTATHVDELDGVGNWIAGETRDAVETLDAEFTGVPDDGDLTIDASWHKGADDGTEGNTAVNTRKIQLVRHVARVVA